MTKIGRKVRNGAQGAYRLSRNGSVCAVTERATGEVKFTGSYAECSEWIGARS